jgi:hypothetical protein
MAYPRLSSAYSQVKLVRAREAIHRLVLHADRRARQIGAPLRLQWDEERHCLELVRPATGPRAFGTSLGDDEPWRFTTPTADDFMTFAFANPQFERRQEDGAVADTEAAAGLDAPRRGGARTALQAGSRRDQEVVLARLPLDRRLEVRTLAFPVVINPSGRARAGSLRIGVGTGEAHEYVIAAITAASRWRS